MARRSSLRSATSQFYINVADNRDLDHTGFTPRDFGYAVFGRVLSGMDIVDRIASVATHTAADMDDVPVEAVMIKGIRELPKAPKSPNSPALPTAPAPPATTIHVARLRSSP